MCCWMPHLLHCSHKCFFHQCEGLLVRWCLTALGWLHAAHKKKFLVQTSVSWQIPLTKRYSRELSESGIRAVQCYDVPQLTVVADMTRR